MKKNNQHRYKIEKELVNTYTVNYTVCDTEQEAQKYIREMRRMEWFENLETKGKFEVKPHHLELMRKMRFTFDYYQPIEGDHDLEFFIPFFRTIMLPPYQAFTHPGDDATTIAQALGLVPFGEDGKGNLQWSEEQEELIGRTYLELKIVLEILTACLKIETGTYRLLDQDNKVWEKV